MKIFPLHLIPNDTKFDFLRLRDVLKQVALLQRVDIVVKHGKQVK